MEDLFKIIVPKEKLHDNFQKVADNIGHLAGRQMLNKIFNSVKAIDKDFIIQFQTKGFDSRIWELGLLAAFQESNFKIERNHNAPDFELIKNGMRIYVEAVATNPSFDQKLEDKVEILRGIKSEEEWIRYVLPLRIDSTLKIASGLTTKLRKKYWEKDWVKGNPLVLAIEPFHHSLAHILSDSNLTGYLYGIENTWQYDKDGNLIVDTHRISGHEHKGKRIESNFFGLPESENISAVIFSNSITISKFTRMGILNGYGSKNVLVERTGSYYDHDPNATVPIPFSYIVCKNGPKENWAQGISMYHNPNALHPIDRELFPDMFHGYFGGHFYSYSPDFWPVNSETIITVFI